MSDDDATPPEKLGLDMDDPEHREAAYDLGYDHERDFPADQPFAGGDGVDQIVVDATRALAHDDDPTAESGIKSDYWVRVRR
jgi:hypothetical protein